MNRRTFLKTATLATIALPNATFAMTKNVEPKWIPLTENFLPKSGQKILLINESGNRIFGGKILEISDHNFAPNMIFLKLNIDFKIQHFLGSNCVKRLFILKEETKGLDTKDWAKKRKGEKSGSLFIKENVGCDIENIILSTGLPTYNYWTPVEGEYPDTLPSFPAFEWRTFDKAFPTDQQYIEVKETNGEIITGWVRRAFHKDRVKYTALREPDGKVVTGWARATFDQENRVEYCFQPEFDKNGEKRYDYLLNLREHYWCWRPVKV